MQCMFTKTFIHHVSLYYIPNSQMSRCFLSVPVHQGPGEPVPSTNHIGPGMFLRTVDNQLFQFVDIIPAEYR